MVIHAIQLPLLPCVLSELLLCVLSCLSDWRREVDELATGI